MTLGGGLVLQLRSNAWWWMRLTKPLVTMRTARLVLVSTAVVMATMGAFQVVSELSKVSVHFRVLALSATPGSDIKVSRCRRDV